MPHNTRAHLTPIPLMCKESIRLAAEDINHDRCTN
jgi:hypothetical protein